MSDPPTDNSVDSAMELPDAQNIAAFHSEFEGSSLGGYQNAVLRMRWYGYLDQGNQLVGFKKVIKSTMHRLGLDVCLVRNLQITKKIAQEDLYRKSWRYFSDLEIRTIIDIGANVGQFAKQIHGVFPQARIYSFEPLEPCFRELKEVIKGIPDAEAFNFGLGQVAGTVSINHSAFSPSSSILPMTEIHKQNWLGSESNIAEDIEILRLDDFFSERELKEKILIKVDVQGWEDQVIRGGFEVFGRASIALLEVCFIELYQGQPLFHDIYGLMRNLGFEYQGNLEQFSSSIDGRILFADAFFLKG